jgi:hypothetical protein
MVRDALTNEGFSSLFPDNFQLAHHAIGLAQGEIQSGNEELSIIELLERIRKEPKEMPASPAPEGDE